MSEIIEIGDLQIAATWEDVLFVGNIKRAELEKFTLDTLAEVIIETAPAGFVYEILLDGNSYTYQRQIDETNENVAANWITELKDQRVLFYNFNFAIGADFDDTIAVQSKKELVFLPVEAVSANLDIRESEKAGEPLKYGGRSRILLEVGRRCKLSFYNDRLGDAQQYLAAHFALQSLVVPEGRGTVAGESFEGESTQWTLPTNNPKANEEELVTTVGKRFMRIRSSRTFRYRFY